MTMRSVKRRSPYGPGKRPIDPRFAMPTLAGRSRPQAVLRLSRKRTFPCYPHRLRLLRFPVHYTETRTLDLRPAPLLSPPHCYGECPMSDALRKRMLARGRKEQGCNFLVNWKSFVKPSECQLKPIFSWPFEGQRPQYLGPEGRRGAAAPLDAQDESLARMGSSVVHCVSLSSILPTTGS